MKRFKRVLDLSNRLFFLCMLLFSLITAFFNWYVALAEVAVTLLVLVLYRRLRLRRQNKVEQAIQTIQLPSTTTPRMSLLNLPLPTCVLRLDDGLVLWGNPSFAAITGRQDPGFDIAVSELVPALPLKWLSEGKSECPVEVKLGNRSFTVFGSLARSEDPSHTLTALLHWVDVTELMRVRSEIDLMHPVMGIIALDNYEEITKNLGDSQKSTLLASIDDRISQLSRSTDGIVRKYDRDRYLCLFEERHLKKLIEGKFALLENVRELAGNAGIPATLSIGLGVSGATPQESLSFANLAVDMALSRGGDQVVIKNKLRFEFFGGKSKELEKRTKVKSRVMAGALKELILDASVVLIMGHKQSDVDAIGAAIGLVAVARKLECPVHIVADLRSTLAGTLIERLRPLREYADVFIDAQTALLLSDRETLLIVVDTCRPEMVESVELLQSIPRVAVIDHHRRAATYIENATLTFHEPYASSTCEMVSEIMQYIIEPTDILKEEADGLLGGVTMDTKNFTMHTGVRTFEAAAYLRAVGADTISIKRLFQTDLKSNLARHAVVAQAEMLNDQIAIAVADKAIDRVIAAQAADDLLNISGIQASFVLMPAAGQIVVSGRSLGDINVQVIAEKLGGGGHQTIAGAQILNKTMEEVKGQLIAAVNEYYAERG